VSTVAQLLVLLDGIAARGQIFVLATTNRPEHIDAALRRPGRFDQVVWMGLPDERGRADIFRHYLRGLKLDPRLAPDQLATEMASATQKLTGADIAYVCQRAAMFCVKEAACGSSKLHDIAIARHHFDAALCLVTPVNTTAPALDSSLLLLAG
jgi:transitional endoplasmic reticulum ATPase